MNRMAKSLVRKLEKDNRNTSEIKLVKALYMEEEYIKHLINESMPEVTVKEVAKVNNNFLEGMYLLTKEELQVRCPDVTFIEKNLLHVTSKLHVPSIISSNLGWRYTVRASYGKGVYFSDEAKLANSICNPNVGNQRAIIVCKVLIGSQRTSNSAVRIPPEGVDTVIGHNGKVFVKFCDHEFLPLFVAFYDMC